MSPQKEDLRAVNEIGKIFNSLTEKKSLCDFFLTSTMGFIGAKSGVLFLKGNQDRLWLESSEGGSVEEMASHQDSAAEVLQGGKPCIQKNTISVPLIVRNDAIGVACFFKEDSEVFDQKDLDATFDLASQMAGALKNILLFEQTLEMQKLAAIGQSMGMVMHEIKNIIQVATFAEAWLQRGLAQKNDKYLSRGYDGFKKALKEMNGFVHEMLSLTKNYKLKPEDLDMQSILYELKDDLDMRAKDLNIELKVEIEEDFPKVHGEQRTLYRALLNMIKNAFEAIDKKPGFVGISVKSLDEHYYQIFIKDNGQGMTEEVKAKLFTAFFSTKGDKGTGLGILIVQKTLQAHGGKINIESEVGKGTTFILTLPKVIHEEEQQK